MVDVGVTVGFVVCVAVVIDVVVVGADVAVVEAVEVVGVDLAQPTESRMTTNTNMPAILILLAVSILFLLLSLVISHHSIGATILVLNQPAAKISIRYLPESGEPYRTSSPVFVAQS